MTDLDDRSPQDGRAGSAPARPRRRMAMARRLAFVPSCDHPAAAGVAIAGRRHAAARPAGGRRLGDRCATLFNAPVEWADDVARGLMVGSSFFGAASAMARQRKPRHRVFRRSAAAGAARAWSMPSARCWCWSIVGLCRLVHARPGWMTTGQTTGSGLPLEWTFYPMGGRHASACPIFAAEHVLRRPSATDRRRRCAILAVIAGLFMAWDRAGARHAALVGRADAGRLRRRAVRRPADRLRRWCCRRWSSSGRTARCPASSSPSRWRAASTVSSCSRSRSSSWSAT